MSWFQKISQEERERPLFAAIRVNGEHFTGSGLDEHWEAIEKALQAGVLRQDGRGKLIYNPQKDDLDLYLTNHGRFISKREADILAAI